MDDKLLEKLARAGVNTFSMNSGLTTEDFGWGSKNFHKMVCPVIGFRVHDRCQGADQDESGSSTLLESWLPRGQMLSAVTCLKSGVALGTACGLSTTAPKNPSSIWFNIWSMIRLSEATGQYPLV